MKANPRTPWLSSYSTLLVALVVLLVAQPLIDHFRLGRWTTEATLVLVLITATLRIVEERRGVLLTSVLAAGAIGGRVVAAAVNELPAWLGILIFILTALFMLRVAVAIGRHILTAGDVTQDTIAGAVCLYLLLGILWALAYVFLAAADPGAFAVADHLAPAVAGRPDFDLFIYFSFVTLTTLGFGDISPISPFARNLVWFEAVVGQLFVAITIARLVSQNVTRLTAVVEPRTDIEEE